MKAVWIISEGSPGHVNQSVGLAEALARTVPVKQVRLETRPRGGGLVRGLLRRLMNGPACLLPWVIRIGLRADMPRGESPDLIISSGGRSVFLGRILSRMHGVPYIFIGERKPYRAECFHTIFTPSEKDQAPNDIAIRMIPTRITPELVAEKGATLSEALQSDRLWSILIGGSSASHRYTDTEWRLLGESMNHLARSHGIRWLVATSRRTGSHAEGILNSALEPGCIQEAVWWSQRPEKKILSYFAASARVFVSQDSVTMVSESIDSGKPVVIFHPRCLNFSETSFLPPYFDRIVAEGLAQRTEISELGGIQLQSPDRQVRAAAQGLADTLLKRLDWSSQEPSGRMESPVQF